MEHHLNLTMTLETTSLGGTSKLEATMPESASEKFYEEETANMLSSQTSTPAQKETIGDSPGGIGTLEVEQESPRLRKEYAVSIRWEREMEERRQHKRRPTSSHSLEIFHMIFCCCARRIGGMFSLLERRDGTPIVIVGPCWPCCSFITLPLIVGISGLVSYYVVFNKNLGLPIWVGALYISIVALTLVALCCVSCRDPGLLERVTDEEAGHGGWFWNEQVGSFRPTGAMYCRECKALIEDFDHLCPWTGTGIGGKNIAAFKFFVVCVNLSCYFSIGLVSYSVIKGIRL